MKANLEFQKIRWYCWILTILLSTSFAFANPVRNYPYSITQPDGKVIECFVTGDYYHYRLFDSNNYTIVLNKTDGWYYYARCNGDILEPTQYAVGLVNPEKVELTPGIYCSPPLEEEPKSQLKSLNAAVNTGDINCLVIFVRFAEDPAIEEPISNYEKIYNDSSTGAFSQYAFFREASYGKMLIEAQLFPKTTGSNVVYYVDKNPRNYYRVKSDTNLIGYTPNPSDPFENKYKFERNFELFYNALLAIQNQIPTDLNLDYNSDGFIDNITLILQGKPDKWGDFPFWGSALIYNGDIFPALKTIKINNKLVKRVSNLVQHQSFGENISYKYSSVLCHEMFHLLGSPDFYHFNFDGFFPLGKWDLMEFNGRIPHHMSSYVKYKYGHWIESIPEIKQTGTYYLQPLTSAKNNCYKVSSPNSTTEYFIIEYRKRTGSFESTLPGSGMLVYKVNTKFDGQGNRDCSKDQNELMVMRPDATEMQTGVVANAFLSKSSGRDKINDLTNPRAYLSNGLPSELDISQIEEVGDSLKFYIRFERSPVADFSSLNTIACNGKISFQNQTSKTLDSCMWTFGDGTFSTELNPVHYYEKTGTYDVKLVVKNNYGSDSIIKAHWVSVDRLIAPKVFEANAICNFGEVTLVAVKSDSFNLNWYEHKFFGTPVGYDSIFNTKMLDSTTIFYVANEFANQNVIVFQKLNNAVTKQALDPSMDDRYGVEVSFDCLNNLVIKSFRCFSQVAKERRIYIRDKYHNPVWDSTLYLGEGEQIIEINKFIEAGIGYYAGFATTIPEVLLCGIKEQYPNQTNDLIRFEGQNIEAYILTKLGEDSTEHELSHFYDWEIEPAACSSPRTPVTVEVIKAKITPRPEVAICKGSALELTSTEASSYLWSPGGETTQSIIVQDSGQYSVSTLIGECENTSLPVFIKYNVENPQIPIDYTVDNYTVDFVIPVVKGFHYQFDFGDGKTKDYDLPTSATKDTIYYQNSHKYPQSGTYLVYLKVTGICSTDSISYPITIGGTSIAENTTNNNLEIFPNPTNVSFQFICPLNNSQSSSVQVFDYLGRQILTQTVLPCRMGETVSIDLSKHPVGIYLVRLKVGGEEFSGKVLLVK